MPVNEFLVPGHATRREFAVYVVVANRREENEFHLYVGKTGDNREGCNPVISRAGNHFSYNEIHSQIRNKLPRHPSEYDYKYFYITFAPYSEIDLERAERVDVTNEMERAVNLAIQKEFPNLPEGCFLNKYKGTGHVKAEEREKRTDLRTAERMVKVTALVEAVAKYVKSLSVAG